MPDTPKNRKQKKDDFLVQGAILAAAAVITKIIGVVYRIPLTNILGNEGNGFYGYAYEIYAMTLMLSSFSLPVAVSKLCADFPRRGSYFCTYDEIALKCLRLESAGAGTVHRGCLGSPSGIFPGHGYYGAHGNLPDCRANHQRGCQHRRSRHSL